MNTKLFGLSIFAVVFALVFGFAAPSVTIAASGHYNEVFAGTPNLFGVDEARNSYALGHRDRDIDPTVNFQNFGLRGDWDQAK